MALLFAIIAMLLISWLQLQHSTELPGASDSIRDRESERPPYGEATASAWRHGQGLFPLFFFFGRPELTQNRLAPRICALHHYYDDRT